MLRNKSLLWKLFFGMILAAQVFASTAELAGKFVEKANDAYENGNISDAYKYINQAMTLTKNDGVSANIIYIAQSIYTKKLQTIRKTKNYIELVDVKSSIVQFPDVENNTIKKLVAQIDAEAQHEKDEQQKEQLDAQLEEQKAARADERTRFETQQQTMRQQQEETRKNQLEIVNKLDTGMQNLNSGLTASAQESKKSSHVMMIAIFVIAGLVILITLIIVFIAHAGFKHQQIQQEQYVEAFKLLAQNQNQTNRLMLGGVTDLYGTNGLKSAGSSRWGMDALPEPEETPEEKTEMCDLAAKCEDLGTKIDQATNRKNNSKNVSELVYKLAMALGLRQREAMVFFCASMVYDAGFLGVAQELLSAESLTDDEREQLKHHIDMANEYLQFVPKRYWQIFEDAANKHHENMDGSGYPDGLKGDAIPQIARLIRVAESYISLSSRRSYHEISDKETAIAKLKEEPNLYDPDVVAALESII
jgi:HD-GYP domain-containing protein (c-di-GMP phosphodiesterase class II)